MKLLSFVFALMIAGFEPCAAVDAEKASLPEPITVTYPVNDSIFPPDMAAPTFLWSDPAKAAVRWVVDVTYSDGTPSARMEAVTDRRQVGDIDPRCVYKTNKAPELTPHEAAMRAWQPPPEAWAAIKKHSVAGSATITISGCREGSAGPVSRGIVALRTSRDPVGAPIFYRDVPLMPKETLKGIIQPLDVAAVPLIAWRLRDVGQARSRLLLENLSVCANCHSFSKDGKTLGMDLDGPANDKGLYALAETAPQMAIRQSDVFSWRSLLDRTPDFKNSGMRLGVMSQVSPDGQSVMSTLKAEMYVANFTNYQFLQVFYPTRGILAFYNKKTGVVHPLPGADDQRYVHTGAAWSPDGKWLAFARAEATDAYPTNLPLARYANDPSEVQIQYDLYRIPFNEGKGGTPEPIAGASRNGKSNSFPKISPDGRWIVFVQSRNGQLMRPDSQLYIVPAAGGEARRLQCNTDRMNSWHSFSPNGRWLVFSSKSRTYYTELFLTHIDEQGNASPAIVIENATAANRAANIPEFVNLPADELVKIDVPAAEQYQLLSRGYECRDKGDIAAAMECFEKAIALDPDYAEVLRAELKLSCFAALPL